MTINWYGGGCYKVQSSGLNIVVDPDSSAGSGGRLKGDLVIKTKLSLPIEVGNIALDEIVGPGEYEISGVKIRGVAAPSASDEIKTAYRVTIDDVRLGFLGDVSAELDENSLDALGEIDILFVPSNAIAGKLIKSVAPKIAVPGWGDPKVVTADVGQKPDPQDKLVIKKKDLESEGGFRLIILEK